MGAGASSGGGAGVWSRRFRVEDTRFLRGKAERQMHLLDWSLVGLSGHQRVKVQGPSSGASHPSTSRQKKGRGQGERGRWARGTRGEGVSVVAGSQEREVFPEDAVVGLSHSPVPAGQEGEGWD